MNQLVDLIPKFGSQNRAITKKNILSDAEISNILKKLDTSPAKVVAYDFNRCVNTIYKIKRNYALIDGELYERIDNGSI